MAAYTGLMTGAGAAGGLETLLARMRAEEQLANQGRQIDIGQWEAEQLAASRDATLAETQRQFDLNAPVREANIAQSQAAAGLSGATATQQGVETDLLRERLPIIRGLSAQLGTGGTGGASSLNTPEGRLRMSMAGMQPTQVFPAGSDWDEDLDAYAKKIGKNSRHDLSWEERNEAMRSSPKYLQGQQRINISAAGLGIRQEELRMRKELHPLKLAQAQKDLEQNVDPIHRQIALAEFQNRIRNDVRVQRTFSEWMQGTELEDPWVQIQRIADEVMQKYARSTPPTSRPGTGRGAGAGGAGGTAPAPTEPAPGSDWRSELQRRRGAGAR